MPTFLQELMTQLRDIWARLDGGQRMILVAVMAAAMVGLSAVVWFARTPEWVVVATLQDPRDFGEAQTVLTGAGIEVRIGDSPFTLEVKTSDMRQASGLIQAQNFGNSSSELLEIEIGDSRDEQKRKLFLNKLRDLENKLERMPAVKSASISANDRERSVFRKMEQGIPNTAAVTLEVRSGYSFESVAQIALSLVQAGLSIPRENIEIADALTNRRLGGTVDAGSAGDLYARQDQIAQIRRRKAEELIERAYGGLATVQVNVELDPKIVRDRIPYMPVPIVVSKQSKDSSTKDQRNTPGGDPSTAAATQLDGNGNPVNASAQLAGGREEKTKDLTTEYAKPGERFITTLAPAIRRMSIALVLDPELPALKAAPDDAAREKVKSEIADAIKNAVGFQETRGQDENGQPLTDSIAVTISPITRDEPVVDLPGPPITDTITGYLPIVGNVVAIALVLLFLRGLVKTASAKPGASGTTPMSAIGPGGSGGGTMSDEELEQTLTPEERTRRMRREIERSIADDPAAMSRLLESWLAEQPS